MRNKALSAASPDTTEAALSRLAAIVASSDDAIISKDLNGTITSWNAGAERMYGYKATEAVGQPITILIPPELREEEHRILETLRKGGRIEHYETVRLTKDGARLDVSLTISPIKNSAGETIGISKIARNISERKAADRELAKMTRKLIEAQEQERSRIGRELHDDINQRLAMLAIEVEQLIADPSEVSTRLQELRKQLIEISSDVQALSHDLHSSTLEYLGVIPGLESWCKGFAGRQGIKVVCTHQVQSSLPQEIGLCLLRVLQEALHNAAKHSGVKQVEVDLSESSDRIDLTVRDSGRGFNVEAVKRGAGLGLTSMKERVRLMHGTISIDSKPLRGTTIHASLPSKVA